MADLCEVLVIFPGRTPFKARVDADNNWIVNAKQMDDVIAEVEVEHLALLALRGDQEMPYSPLEAGRWADNLLTQLPDSRILYCPGQDDPLPDDARIF